MNDAHLTYTRDDGRRRITVAITGPARLDDLTGVVERQAADGTGQYAILYDERVVTAPLSVDATHALLAVVARLNRAHGPGGPVAIVCKALNQFGMPRMYSTLGEDQGLDSEVFHDRAKRRLGSTHGKRKRRHERHLPTEPPRTAAHCPKTPARQPRGR